MVANGPIAAKIKPGDGVGSPPSRKKKEKGPQNEKINLRGHGPTSGPGSEEKTGGERMKKGDNANQGRIAIL